MASIKDLQIKIDRLIYLKGLVHGAFIAFMIVLTLFILFDGVK